MKANESKSSYLTFTLRKERCPPVVFKNIEIPRKENTKYLGMHFGYNLINYISYRVGNQHSH